MTVIFRIILILVSLVTFVEIVKRIRNAKMQIEASLFWIVFSVILLLFSIFPQIADILAGLLGIYSTTNFIFLFVIFLLLVHEFFNSIKISQLEQRVRELVQELAVRDLREREREKTQE